MDMNVLSFNHLQLPHGIVKGDNENHRNSLVKSDQVEIGHESY